MFVVGRGDGSGGGVGSVGDEKNYFENTVALPGLNSDVRRKERSWSGAEEGERIRGRSNGIVAVFIRVLFNGPIYAVREKKKKFERLRECV